jgi:CRISPR-associated protein Cst2
MQNYEEFDLFGTMLTKDLFKGLEKKEAEKIKEGIKRTAAVKLSFAFSISKFQGDMDFLNNIDTFNRWIKHLIDKDSKRAQIISQSEQHTAHYHYTLAVDLDRIGLWEGESGVIDVLSSKEKAKRVNDLLDAIMTLSRQIRGRWETLAPVLVIGGIYRIKNPFFMGCIFARELEFLINRVE